MCALHACGPASDAVLDRAIASHAQHILVVPCCTGNAVREMAIARKAADTIGIPRHSAVRRTFLESWIASERTLRLEAAGYETEVVPFVPETVTPYNLLWRARRVGEPRRAERRGAEHDQHIRMIVPFGVRIAQADAVAHRNVIDFPPVAGELRARGGLEVRVVGASARDAIGHFTQRPVEAWGLRALDR